jgi:asparagine synthase (glutamine-hydrolysing)
MCGITGVIGKHTPHKDSLIREMNNIISHRGPDDDGFFVDDAVALGMRRLSIIDLAGGKQPIESADGNKLIFFNGEIYNYKELREDLEKEFSFKTHTDTEVILHLYEKEGEAGILKLRGMFAICIYDKVKEEVLLVRDYFGIKPIYYIKKDKQILGFASEIKSLLAHPEYKKEINDEAVYNYLRFQYNPLEETMFKGIFKLLPGHLMRVDLKNNSFSIKKYYSFAFNEDSGMNEAGAAGALRETMEDSVAHHMIADVPVGSFLSGGIDSSINATLMQKVLKGTKDLPAGRQVSTFTIGFEEVTEGQEAKVTSNFLGTDHSEIKVDSKDYFAELPKIVWHFDEPVADPSAVALYFLAREARKKVKVVLSGEGSDEFFGGYNIYLAPYAYRVGKLVPQFIRKAISPFIYNSDKKFFGKNYIKRCIENIEDWYIGNASIFKEKELKNLWTGEKQNFFSLREIYEEVKNQSDSTKMQYVDMNTWLPGDILAKADKMTMAHSLELRVPFLDKEVADFARRIPDRLKWKNGQTKYLLREAFKNVLPEETRKRKKLGFPTPIRHWFTEKTTDQYKIILDCPYIKNNLDISKIQKMIDDHVDGKEDNARKIYILLLLGIWHQQFFPENM